MSGMSYAEIKIGEETALPETFAQGDQWLLNVSPKELYIQPV